MTGHVTFSDVTDDEIEGVVSLIREHVAVRYDRRNDPLAGVTRKAVGTMRVLANLCRPPRT